MPGRISVAGGAGGYAISPSYYPAPLSALGWSNYSAPAAVTEVAYTVVSGTVFLSGIALPAGARISNISFHSMSTAMVSGTHQQFGLYDLSLNRLAVTSDDTSTAWGTWTLKTLALTTPYTVTSTGVYLVGLLVAAGTPPNIMCGASHGQSGFQQGTGFTALFNGTSSTAQTSLPATAGSITAVVQFPWFVVS